MMQYSFPWGISGALADSTDEPLSRGNTAASFFPGKESAGFLPLLLLLISRAQEVLSD